MAKYVPSNSIAEHDSESIKSITSFLSKSVLKYHYAVEDHVEHDKANPLLKNIIISQKNFLQWISENNIEHAWSAIIDKNENVDSLVSSLKGNFYYSDLDAMGIFQTKSIWFTDPDNLLIIRLFTDAKLIEGI